MVTKENQEIHALSMSFMDNQCGIILLKYLIHISFRNFKDHFGGECHENSRIESNYVKDLL